MSGECGQYDYKFEKNNMVELSSTIDFSNQQW